MPFKISELYVYPIKSLSGIKVQKSILTAKGLQYDRRWVLTDTEGQFITQRKLPQLVFFKTQLTEKGLVVSHKDAATDILIPIRGAKEDDHKMRVTVWGDEVNAVIESTVINAWFSKLMGFEVYLAFLPNEDGQRRVKNHVDAPIDFPDAAPYLVLGQVALNHLNSLLEIPIPINRFRANIIFEGGTPNMEDDWTAIKIRKSDFEAVKTCARCQVTTTDQETGVVSKEPIRTLATYRKEANRILFGRYFKLKEGEGIEISVGDKIEV
ncbi:MAG: MOSC domain-containing protein [Chitinophagales bacterium]